MSTQPSLYHNPERKRELIGLLKAQHEYLLEVSKELDEKAWEILRVTGGTFGIVSGLFITLVAPKAPSIFWIGMASILGLYLIQLQQVMQVISPRQWPLIPGGSGGGLSYESLLDKYFLLNPEEDDFLNQLIADYAGNFDVNNNNIFVDGAIQKVEANNAVKAKRVRLASLLLGVIIASLVSLGVVVLVA